MKGLSTLCLAYALTSVGVVTAKDWYVAVSGSDSNAGTTSQAPFGTLQHVQQVVRDSLSSGQSEDINVHIAAGVYALASPIKLTSADSGRSGFKVNWIGANATISGGLKVTGWTAGSDNVYSASVPAGTVSRNLYVNGKAANYARRAINRKDFQFTSTSMKWSNSAYDWLNSLASQTAEIRFINSFTDRYAPIATIKNRELVMKQPSWANNNMGYDTVNNANADFGVYVQNVLSLLKDSGQYFLDSAAGKVYYKPLNGEDMTKVDTYLGTQEVLFSIGGSYQDPAHDIAISGLTFAHTTWKDRGLGYVDQQTGGYIGNATYPNFESARPHWLQMLSAVQISAATRITLSGCTYTQLGAGGMGIGNDANAHLSGVGLGASNVSVLDSYFTQVMGNSITAGGIQADGHHPSDNKMINKGIVISGNIFYNTSSLFTSTVPIFVSYLQYSSISNNDISTTPYSGICHGYGWGSNDAGGSPEYQNRGLYNYQPKYQTPTVMHDNKINGNLIHDYGKMHTDLGAIYTLSISPNTVISENYAYDSNYYGVYTDEGSGQYLITNNALFSNGPWFAPNYGAGNVHTGNNTLTNNVGKSGPTLNDAPNHSGDHSNTYQGNQKANSISQASTAARRVAYNAGIPPSKRAGRPVSNDPKLPNV